MAPLPVTLAPPGPQRGCTGAQCRDVRIATYELLVSRQAAPAQRKPGVSGPFLQRFGCTGARGGPLPQRRHRAEVLGVLCLLTCVPR